MLFLYGFISCWILLAIIAFIKDNMDFKFLLDKNSYLKIKKLAAITPDDINDILTLSINDNILTIGENNWDLNICNIEHENMNITFPKKYFKSITFSDDAIDIYVFDSFLLVDNQNTTLLISLELTI